MHPDWNAVVDKLDELAKAYGDKSTTVQDPATIHTYNVIANIFLGLAEALECGLYPDWRE